MILRITKILFLLLIFSLPFVRPLNPLIFGLRVTVTDFIFPTLFIFWLISLLTKQTRLKRGNFYYFLAFYAFSLILSTIFSAVPGISIYKLPAEFYLIFLAVITFNLVNSVNFFKKVTLVWLTATSLTFLASFAGLILFYLGYKSFESNIFLYHFGTLPSGNYPRLQALFANANMLCNYLNVSLIFTLLAYKLNWLKPLLARILFAGIWFAAIFTISPGLGGLMLSLGVWFSSVFYFERKTKLASSFLLIGILGSVLFFASSLISIDTPNTDQDFYLPFSSQKFEPSVRVLVWEGTLKTIGRVPFLGNGTGLNVTGISYTTLSGEPQFLTDAHNVWLNQFGQLGIVGFLAFSLLITFLFSKCRFYVIGNNVKFSILAALSCGFLGAFLYQGLNGSYEDARHLWILFGLLAAAASDDFIAS